MVGEASLFAERHLAADPGQRLLARATIAGHEPGDLRGLVGDHDDQPIHVLVVAALDHHRRVEHDDTAEFLLGEIVQSPLEDLPDPRMRDRLEPPPALGVGEHDTAERLPVEPPVGCNHPRPELPHDLGERGLARLHHLAGEHVGIDDHRAQHAEHRCDRALAGGDPPGQPDEQEGTGLHDYALYEVTAC